MLLTDAQRVEYAERGFVVLRDVDGIAPLTVRMVEVCLLLSKRHAGTLDSQNPAKALDRRDSSVHAVRH